MTSKKLIVALVLFFLTGSLLGVAKESIIVTKPKERGRNIRLHMDAGEQWEHTFTAGSISIKTTPQIAVWIEDPDGNYIDTLYVTRRTATQKWRGKPGPYEEKGNIRRKASLPYWAHKRGVRYSDGLFLPTKKEPLPDSVTAASPKESFQLRSCVPEAIDHFVLLVEINNSTDFNEYFNRDAAPSDPAFSGGSFGSGQPALVYRTSVQTGTDDNIYELELAGHSSPYGENGNLNTDVTRITTAKQIVDRITVLIE
jgi:hypothetical protein